MPVSTPSFLRKGFYFTGDRTREAYLTASTSFATGDTIGSTLPFPRVSQVWMSVNRLASAWSPQPRKNKTATADGATDANARLPQVTAGRVFRAEGW